MTDDCTQREHSTISWFGRNPHKQGNLPEPSPRTLCNAANLQLYELCVKSESAPRYLRMR